METARAKTYGERLVGVEFNPGKLPEVDRLKQLFAEAADIVRERCTTVTDRSLGAMFEQNAYHQILLAQMSCVKAVTNQNA